MKNVIFCGGSKDEWNQIKEMMFFQNGEYVLSGEMEDGEKVLSILKNRKIDIAIIDVTFAEAGGLKLLKKIRAAGYPIYVIVVSQCPNVQEAMAAMRLEAQDYCQKPLDDKTLRKSLLRLENQRKRSFVWETELFSAGDRYQMSSLLCKGKAFSPILAKRLSNQKKDMQMAVQSAQKEIHELFVDLICCVHNEFPWMKQYLDSEMTGKFRHAVFSDWRSLRTNAILTAGEIEETVCSLLIQSNSVLIQRVRDYILVHIEGDLSLRAVAERFNVNHTYLSHIFKKQTGIAYTDFVTSARIRKGKVLLLKNWKIGEIAAEVGYDHSEYFSKVFRKCVRLSPKEFRNFTMLPNAEYRVSSQYGEE